MNQLGQWYVSVRDALRALTNTVPATPEEEQRALREAVEGAWPQPEEAVKVALERAARTVPYYADIARPLGDGRNALENWPVLTKDILRREGRRMHASHLDELDASENTSGGSTGKPIRFWHDRVFRERANAARLFHSGHLLGIHPNMSQVVLWGSERDILEHRSDPSLFERLEDWMLVKLHLKTTHLNAFRMTEEELDRYIRTIQYERPEIIHSYAGSLYQLARRAQAQGQRLPSPKRIYTTAETLQPFMRECIEAVFSVKVQDFYGSREVGPIAGQTTDGAMVTFDFLNVVEVVDDAGQPVAPGETGRILITNLHNHAMPFIRYEIGDMGIRGRPYELNGRTFGTLERVIGRITDHFVTSSGTLVHGEYFTHLFYFQDWVDEFQVNQLTTSHLQVLYKSAGTPAPDTMKQMEDKMRVVMGDHCRIEWQQVPEVPRTREGKLLFTRCLIPNDDMPGSTPAVKKSLTRDARAASGS